MAKHWDEVINWARVSKYIYIVCHAKAVMPNKMIEYTSLSKAIMYRCLPGEMRPRTHVWSHSIPVPSGGKKRDRRSVMSCLLGSTILRPLPHMLLIGCDVIFYE